MNIPSKGCKLKVVNRDSIHYGKIAVSSGITSPVDDKLLLVKMEGSIWTTHLKESEYVVIED